MDRIKPILENEEFIKRIKQISESEEDRIYCKHDLAHALDVARIAFIKNLEENIGLSKDCIYATALLHDIGRAEEYKSGTEHKIAAIAPAMNILRDAGFSSDEIEGIISSISNHSGKSKDKSKSSDFTDSLSELLTEADRLSRTCFICNSSESCKWDDDMKNTMIEY